MRHEQIAAVPRPPSALAASARIAPPPVPRFAEAPPPPPPLLGLRPAGFGPTTGVVSLAPPPLRESIPPRDEASEFALLVADRRGAFPAHIVARAASTEWLAALRVSLAGSRRAALHAARVLQACGAHTAHVARLERHAQCELLECVLAAMEHPSPGVWLRAARALGPLASALDPAAEALERALSQDATAPLRERAHAALVGPAPCVRATAQARRASVLRGSAPEADAAAYAAGLASLEPPGLAWESDALRLIAHYGVEVWASVARTLREITRRRPDQRDAARAAAAALVLRIARVPRGELDAHSAATLARTDALAAALIRPGSTADSPAALVDWLCEAAPADDPFAPRRDERAGAVLSERAAHLLERAGAALRTAGHADPESAAPAWLYLEDLTEQLVDGDLIVLAERLSDARPERTPERAVGTLAARLFRGVADVLRAVDPHRTPAWAQVLARLTTALGGLVLAGDGAARALQNGDTRGADAMAHLADCAARWPGPVARVAVEGVVELAGALPGAASMDAAAAALAWMAVRTGNLQAPIATLARVLAQRQSRGTASSVASALEHLAATDGPPRAEDLVELGHALGAGCALGAMLISAGPVLARRPLLAPLSHWAGLPRLDLLPLARLADQLARARSDPAYALGADDDAPEAGTNQDLAARAMRPRELPAGTEGDAGRRADAQSYLLEARALCDALHESLGPLVGNAALPALRTVLSRAERDAQAAVSEHAGLSRYIGRLHLGECLHGDAQSVVRVVLADGPVPGRPVVVKIIASRALAGQRGALARRYLEREAERLATLSHPNVVSIVDAGFVAEGVYLALEHIAGESLEGRVARGPIDLRTLAPVVADMARALGYLHSRGVVHRDVKPANIMLQLERSLAEPEQIVRAVLIDLGIATDSGTALVPAEGIMGTPGYLPPEVVVGSGAVLPAVDAYALGVVVFEALAGYNPFLRGAGSLPEVLVRHGRRALPLDDLPDVAQRPALRALLAAATHPDPERRPAMAAFLEAWLAATR